MQLYARDENHQLIPASKAQRHIDYTCLECGASVRLRKGIHRQAHFFHLTQGNVSCKLQAKGMVHLQVQSHLLNLLPKGECILEKPFAEIRRIADAVWLTQNLIFEIQFSSITAQEIEARNRDYASLGFQVIWILHERQFNQYRLTGAEVFLRFHPYFFTDIDEEGKGKIYDQLDLSLKEVRVQKWGCSTVDVSRPFPLPAINGIELPIQIQERLKSWPLHFSGDWIDHIKTGSIHFDEALKGEKRFLPGSPSKNIFYHLKKGFWTVLLRPYQLLFQMFLEKSCK